MKEEAKTYDDLIRKKRCVDITNYYELTEENLEIVYNFLKDNKDGSIKGGYNSLVLTSKNNQMQVVPAKKISYSIDGLIVTNKLFRIIPHYTPSSSGYSSGGSSSNNNNNNNNNINNNN